MRILLISVILLSGLIIHSSAQTSDKYGSDRDLCLRNYSLYKGYFKNGGFKDAKIFWQEMVRICPGYSTGVWSDGEKIFKEALDNTDDPVRRVELIDSLIWTYDQRIKYFGEDLRYPKGYILGKKGIALLDYEVQPLSGGYQTLKESVELQGNDSYAAVILSLMKATKSMFSSGQIDAREVINNYSICNGIAEANLVKSPGDNNFKVAREGIEHYLISSGAADCSTLVDVFSVQFVNNKKNSEWLKKVSGLLKASGCSETEFYRMTIEAVFVIEPSAESAHEIANMYFTNGNYEKAVEYLAKGVEIGSNTEEKADMFYELAYIHYVRMKDYQHARMYARKASELRPNWGDPYILIGKMYIDDRKSVSGDNFEQSAVFWAAVDQFIKAKQMDPEQSQKANELIYQYSQYFPINEDVFMYTLKDGQEYKVGGWINEETTVRSRKN